MIPKISFSGTAKEKYGVSDEILGIKK